MRIDVNVKGDIVLREVYEPIRLVTPEGNALIVCMQDDTFEMIVLPEGAQANTHFRIDMQRVAIERMDE